MVTKKFIPTVSVGGERGAYKVFVKNSYGTTPFSGQKFKRKIDASKSAKRVKNIFFKGNAKLKLK